jgi:hypothetical protein
MPSKGTGALDGGSTDDRGGTDIREPSGAVVWGTKEASGFHGGRAASLLIHYPRYEDDMLYGEIYEEGSVAKQLCLAC